MTELTQETAEKKGALPKAESKGKGISMEQVGIGVALGVTAFAVVFAMLNA